MEVRTGKLFAKSANYTSTQ